VPSAAVAPDAQSAVKGAFGEHAGPDVSEGDPPVNKAVSANIASPLLAPSGPAVADAQAKGAELQPAVPSTQAMVAAEDAPAASIVAGDAPPATAREAVTVPAEASAEAMTAVLSPEAAGGPSADANGVSHEGLLADEPAQVSAPAALGPEEVPATAQLEGAESRAAPSTAPNGSASAAEARDVSTDLFDGALHC
jgi:hypothetical protein